MFERRSYNDGVSMRCTVKFRGAIPNWPGETALGVEWDDSSRGRNNGELGGVRYFTCAVPGSGAFLKASRPPEPAVSFETAVASKYLDRTEYEEIQLSEQKTIETVGIDKIRNRQSDIDALTSISLENCLVANFESEMQITFSSLQRLDLSNNLLSDFRQLATFLSTLPALRSVKLNGNRFDPVSFRETEDVVACPQVEEVDLAATLITAAELAVLARYFPNLRELSLAHNRFSTVPQSLPPLLSVLDLAHNPLSELAGIPSHLQSLYASYTNVSRIPNHDYIPPHLDLRGSGRLAWEDISRLGAHGVTVLQLHDLNDGALSLSMRPFIISRCPDLVRLDGTAISAAERFDAGLYTVSAVVSKKHPAVPAGVWDKLVALHGLPPAPPDKSIRGRLISFYVDDSSMPLRIVRDAPLQRLHWLVAHSKNGTPRTVHIKGITDVPKVENDALANLSEAGDLLVDGQRIVTYAVSD